MNDLFPGILKSGKTMKYIIDGKAVKSLLDYAKSSHLLRIIGEGAKVEFTDKQNKEE